MVGANACLRVRLYAHLTTATSAHTNQPLYYTLLQYHRINESLGVVVL
jgi:hypothetical protein